MPSLRKNDKNKKMKTPVQELIEVMKERIPFFQYSVYQDDFDWAIENEKKHIIDAANFLPHDEQNEIKTAEEYYEQTYNNKYKIEAERLIQKYMKIIVNGKSYIECFNSAKEGALLGISDMIEVCNKCLLYTKQPVRENDDIYNFLVKVKNEINKIKK